MPPRLGISIVIWILSSDTICQLNQFNTNSEAAMLSSLLNPAYQTKTKLLIKAVKAWVSPAPPPLVMQGPGF